MSQPIHCPHCGARLYGTDILEKQCSNCHGKLKMDTVAKPFGPWGGFNECVAHMTKPKSEGGGGYTLEQAKRVCGKLQSRLGEKK
uniref:Uncharacterized protein n=2 Tax=viral metagenome TaxID=1070528 RepID=A0A6M3L338_9ZZZZ